MHPDHNPQAKRATHLNGKSYMSHHPHSHHCVPLPTLDSGLIRPPLGYISKEYSSKGYRKEAQLCICMPPGCMYTTFVLEVLYYTVAVHAEVKGLC